MGSPPAVIASGVEVQHQSLGADPGLDLVLDFLGTDEYPTEIAGRPTALAAPHAPRHGAAQGSHRQPTGPLLRRRLLGPSRLRPNHDDNVLADPQAVVRATRTSASRVYIIHKSRPIICTLRLPSEHASSRASGGDRRVAHRIPFASLPAFRYVLPAGRPEKATGNLLLESFCRGFWFARKSGRSLREIVRGAKRTASEVAPGIAVFAWQHTPPGAWCTGHQPLPASTGRSPLFL